MIRLACRVGVLGVALGALGLVGAHAQFRGVGGVGGGFGGRGFGGFGGFHRPVTNVNITVPYGYGYGYPVVAAYGAGYPGWGWGAGWDYYYGGPFGGIGYSLYDVEALKQQQYALNDSRYNVENAQATQAYAAANFYQQQAIATAMENARQTAAMRPKYDPTTGSPAMAPQPTPGHPTVPLDRLIDEKGQVIWPAFAPRNDARGAADSAYQVAAQEYRQRGRASVAAALDAREKLYAYGRPALAKVRREQPPAGEPFKDFLNNLDVSLDLMADPPAKPAADTKGQEAPPPPPRPAAEGKP